MLETIERPAERTVAERRAATNGGKRRALVYCAGGGFGDSLVSSVVAQALRRRYAAVDALTLSGHRATLERCPDFDKVLIDDGGEERALATVLRARGYAACVVTWATARTAHVPQLAEIPVRAGQARRLYSWRFTHRVPVRSEHGDVTTHWSQIQLDYARALGCDAPGARPRFVPTPADESEATTVLERLGLTTIPFVVLHPTNAEAARRGVWPTQGWSVLSRALAERFGAPVLVSGAQADAPFVDAIVAGVPPEFGVHRIAGALSIGAFGALAARARLFVGITTGTMHVAAAVGAPTVGIFPFQSDVPERWAPLGPRTAIVRPSYPCHRGDTKERCPDYACIVNLNIPGIIAAAERLYKGNDFAKTDVRPALETTEDE